MDLSMAWLFLSRFEKKGVAAIKMREWESGYACKLHLKLIDRMPCIEESSDFMDLCSWQAVDIVHIPNYWKNGGKQLFLSTLSSSFFISAKKCVEKEA